MTSIRDIEGLEPKYASMLAENGVRTTEQLLELADTSAKRVRLADQTNIGEDQILGWVHQADLLRVHGISKEFAALLVRAGVVTVPKLAYRSAAHLYEDLVACNDTHHIVHRVPSAQKLEQMIGTAKQLPKLIHH